MYAIVAVSSDWGIGRDNGLLFSIPEDMKFFREKTTGNTVIMGRKTLESMPGGRPLKDRRNIVLTRSGQFNAQGAVTAASAQEAVELARGHGDIYVIGGEEIYRLFLPEITLAYVTHVDAMPQAERFFPDLSCDPEWELAKISLPCDHEGIKYRFAVYKRK